ncbi:FimV/HubP family polar landmark protein [Halomonas sp. M4R5S39]|uniref:FimV/HubP family polar landmark protein n=1 Tax=Halomonas kalidii TaxID=3043293 RepID=UPI0024A88AC6|nr:FimV/HubP family polar landmark protein [Halomonas kalidii]MDI5985833.1 FimV/HubP family polar landmark protein [Halomonas kalidii]
MKRKLTLAMLLSLSAASPLALALGLGEADVRSTLNAPLRASIPLTDTDGMSSGLLNVSVAGDRAFSAAGLVRTPLAASVRLAVEQREGRLVLDLTTEHPVREPWLDLLLRFDWPGGRQLREVTLLLDPPDYDQMPALIGAPARATATAAATPPGQEPSGTPRPVVRPSAQGGSGDPAWVRGGDTLWAVAGRLRPDSGISMNQMMVALVEANPEVFPSGNINAMRAGFTLVVPGRDAIAARSSGEAERVVQAMNQAWANRGSGAPTRVPLGGSEEVAPQTAVAAIGADETPSPAATEGEEGESVEGPRAADGEEAPRLTLLTDAEAAAEGALAVGIAEEGEGGEGVATATGERVVIDPMVLQALHGDGDLTSDDRLLRLEARWLENRQALEAVRRERDELQGELIGMREELEALRDQLAALSAGGQGVDGPGTGGVVPPGGDGRESTAESPWWGAFYQGRQDRIPMLGGIALAALLALWALVRRRQRRDETASTFAQVQAVAPGGSSVAGSAVGPVVAGTGEAAPVRASMPQAEAINEADIFIAYGRYDQARELLEAGLEREPERDDLRLKLLMVHLEQGSHGSAEREAERLRAGGDPLVLAEVEELMKRRPAPSDASATPAGGERAVFAAPAELPPRRFDEADEEPSPAASEPGGEPAERVADDAPEPERGGDPAARYRRPESESESESESEPVSEPEPEGDVRPVRASPDAPRPEAREDEPPPAPRSPSAPPPSRRADEAGRNIIDYRPPTLDPSPAPRGETPMQPSVEFSPAESKAPGDDDHGPAGGADDWEVEEVAFPPLDRDNEWLSAGASSASTLAEARRLLDEGEVERARPLLHRLAEGADDPSVREEARALITRHDL